MSSRVKEGRRGMSGREEKWGRMSDGVGEGEDEWQGGGGDEWQGGEG